MSKPSKLLPSRTGGPTKMQVQCVPDQVVHRPTLIVTTSEVLSVQIQLCPSWLSPMLCVMLQLLLSSSNNLIRQVNLV